MKKLCFLILFLLIGTISFAQKGGKKSTAQNQGKSTSNAQKHKTPEEKADMGTRKLTGLVDLTSEQQPRVRELLLAKAQKIQSIREKYATSQDKSKMHTEIKAVKEETQSSLKTILTPQQYDKYVKAKEEKKNKKKEEKAKAKTTKEPVDEEETDDLDID